MKEENKWLDSLKSKMEDYECDVPEDLWNDVESSIFRKDGHRRTVVPPWLWRGAAVAAVIVSGVFALIRISDRSVNAGDESYGNGPVSPQNNPSSVIAEGNRDSSLTLMPAAAAELQTERVGNLIADAGKKSRSVEAVSAVQSAPEENRESEISQESGIGQEPEVSRESADTPVAESGEDTAAAVKPLNNHDDEDWSGYAAADSHLARKHRISATFDLSVSGSPSEGQNVSSYDPLMFYRGSSPDFSPSSMEFGNPVDRNGGLVSTRAATPAMLAYSSPISTTVEHKRPIRIALTVRVPLYGRLGIESGLSYTMLHSSFSTVSGNSGTSMVEDVQVVRCLGVPVNLTYSLLDRKLLSAYVSAGGMAEKVLSGYVATTQAINETPQGSSVSNPLKDKPLYWSLNASAGLQANVSRYFGIYAAPGVSWHLDNGSQLRTIYSDRPVDFVMTFGARFSF